MAEEGETSNMLTQPQKSNKLLNDIKSEKQNINEIYKNGKLLPGWLKSIFAPIFKKPGQ